MSCKHLAEMKAWAEKQLAMAPDIIMVPGDMIDNGCRPMSAGAEAELAFWTELAKTSGKPIILGTQKPPTIVNHMPHGDHRPAEITKAVTETWKDHPYTIMKAPWDYSNQKAYRITRNNFGKRKP